jgi:mono/diheme cytochrome c family protein
MIVQRGQTTRAVSRMPRRLCAVGGLVLLLFLAASRCIPVVLGDPPPRPPSDQAPVFEAQVQKIFQARCSRCHGAKRQRAGLMLTTREGVLRGSESGPVVVAGHPEKSRLFELLRSGTMPPKKEPRLPAGEIETIRKWIAAGATFRTSPSPVRPEVTQNDILPLLQLRCTVCHGLRRKEAGLDLRTRAGMLRGGKSGPGIVPGKPEQSLLLKKIRSGAMPPPRQVVSVSVKPMEPQEVGLLTRWIKIGAPETLSAPDIATTSPDLLVSDDDRHFWAFQPPRAVPVPAPRHAGRVRTPIDAFILQKLEERGLTLSPEASRLTLMRRAYFDLTGLPPEPAEIKAYLADTAPDAYERLIDRLLASPHYGERWGRYWLDLAGYSDSEGVQDSDLFRPEAWRYRDYVIRSFNADRPYDRFLLEQIAGDELVDYEHAPVITDEIYSNLVATGFLRMAIDGTFADITNFVPDRLEVVAREMEVLTSSVMGLTIRCARCHSHKYDPIPQRDYYRLAAIFKGALDENDWLKPQRQKGPPGQHDRYLPQVTTRERQAWQQHEQQIQTQIDALKKGPRTSPSAARIKALEAARKPEPVIRALWDRGEPSPTYILKRGNYLTPGRLVGPGVPSVLTDGKTPFEVKPPFPGARKTGRRLAFARWLTRPDHPLTARVMVNRIWKQHLGTGLVKTLDNFGKAGARPTHPELLDWLAVEFVRRGWSVKAMHRLILTSAAYRQTSHVSPLQEKADPDNRLQSRMPLRRIDAEVLRDTLIAIDGRLDRRMYGPGDPVKARPDGLVTSVGTEHGWRRSIYTLQRRMQIPTILESFDFPQMSPNCIERRQATVVLQPLLLRNNGQVNEWAGAFARRVVEQAGTDPARQVDLAFLLAFGRRPSDSEQAICLESLDRLTKKWTDTLGSPKQPTAAMHAEASRRALTNLCRALINAAELLYID